MSYIKPPLGIRGTQLSKGSGVGQGGGGSLPTVSEIKAQVLSEGAGGNAPVIDSSGPSTRSNPLFRNGVSQIGSSPSSYSEFLGRMHACMMDNKISRATTERSLENACRECDLPPIEVEVGHLDKLLPFIEKTVGMMVERDDLLNVLGELRLLGRIAASETRDNASGDVDLIPSNGIAAGAESGNGVSIEINLNEDILAARSSAMDYALEIGFGKMEAPKVANIVSELARNIIAHAGLGTIELVKIDNGVRIIASDSGPGIEDVDRVLAEGKGKSSGGGLKRAKRLADAGTFDIKTAKGEGTTVTATKTKMFRK